MKSWVLTAPRSFELLEQESPPVDRAEMAKIKLDACLLSATALKIYNGDIKGVSYPIVPGRHGAGVVSEISPDNECCLEKGERIVVDPFMPCGVCFYCKTDKSELCPFHKIFGLSTDGLFTDFKTLKCNMLHRIPEHMPLETALYAEYVAVGLSVINKMDIKEGEHVAIFSACKSGYILAQLVAYYQAIPIIIEYDKEQLAKLSSEQIGFVIDPKSSDLSKTVNEITGGRKCEKVVYIPNSTTDLNDAIACCGYNASLCISGRNTVPGGGDFLEIQRKQLTVSCVANGHKNFPSAINLLATKTIKHLPEISQKVSFTEVPKAFAEFELSNIRYAGTKIEID